MAQFCVFVTVVLAQVLPVTIATGLVDAPKAVTDAERKKPLVGKYSMYRKKLTWGDAQNYCEHHEGHLATFINIQDAQAVIDKIFEVSDKVTTEYLSGAQTAEFGLDRRYWIGLTDLVSGEGNWVWAGVGKPLTYHALWYPGQPDHIDKQGKYIGRPEHCVALWNPVFHKGDRKHSWVDQECNKLYYFVCEADQEKMQTQEEWKNKNKNKTSAPLGRGLGGLQLGNKPPPNQAAGRSIQLPPSTKSVQPNPRDTARKTANFAPKPGLSGNANAHPVQSAQSSKPVKKKKMGVKLGRNVLAFTQQQPAIPKKMTRAHERPHYKQSHENRSDSDDHWRSLPGFSELFQPSQSTSIEDEARENYIEVRKHHLGPEANEPLY